MRVEFLPEIRMAFNLRLIDLREIFRINVKVIAVSIFLFHGHLS